MKKINIEGGRKLGFNSKKLSFWKDESSSESIVKTNINSIIAELQKMGSFNGKNNTTIRIK